MKKTLVLLVVLCAASSAFAGPVSMGLLVTWAPLEYQNQTVLYAGNSDSVDYTFETLGARAYIDLVYLEGSVGIATCVTQLTTKVSVGGTSIGSMNTNFSINELDVRLVGKYPFTFGSFTIFPLAGFSKFFCLSGNDNGVDFTSDEMTDFSAWFLLAGVGTDIKFASKFYMRAELTAAYNLTSKRSPSYYTGTTYQSSSGWEVQLAAGVGYSF